jgi:oxygen tolerance protein BatD
VIAALALLAALQGSGALQVLTSLDHDRVVPGDEVVLTVTVLSRSTVPIQVSLPTLTGFVLISREERSDVTAGQPPSRTTSLVLRLRADKPGSWRIGPFQVRQGHEYAQGDPVSIEVEGSGSAASTSLSLRLARLLDRAPVPGGLDEAAVSVVVSDDSVVVGEQVDVVTIAWFDREIRQQLRRAPTVEGPRMEGVWSYPQPAPGGIAASRRVGGRWYDLFVLHQVVFPLQPGRVVVAPARLQYSMPLAFQFFSQEERYSLLSDTARFAVGPLPGAGRPADFTGAVAQDLSVVQSLSPPAGRQGEAFSFEVTLKGSGNVSLWPLPAHTWPPELRAYSEGTRDAITVADGRLGGRKTFRFLLVPDSAGEIQLPAIPYTYFDPVQRAYHTATAEPMNIMVAPRGEGQASRPAPPPIRLDRREPLATALRSALPGPSAWLLVILPPLVFFARRMRWRRRRLEAPPRPADPLADAERRLDALLATLVEDPVEREAGLREALSRAGIARPLVERIARSRSAIRGLRYGGMADQSAAALCREAESVLAALAARPALRRRMLSAGLLVVAVGLPAGMVGQSGPELYEAGAYHAAGDAFARQAAQEPAVPAHWLNLGAARYREGDDAAALAAWVSAARLRPRDPATLRALDLVPAADPGSGRWLWVAPASADELWLIATIAWIAGWLGMAAAGRARGRWLVVLAGAALVGGFGATLDRWYHRPLAVVRSGGSLRRSPHELAPTVGELPRLAVVLERGDRGAWLEVIDAEGRRGWIKRELLSPVGR